MLIIRHLSDGWWVVSTAGRMDVPLYGPFETEELAQLSLAVHREPA